MTIYYSLTFLLLAAEMVTFCMLVSPLPYPVRKRIFSFLSTSPVVAKIAYGLKISFIFVAILFADALQRMFRVAAESDLAKSGRHGVQDVRVDTNIAARKFYAQRNTYLTGFCLFLSLVLTRTFYIILDLIHTQEEYAKLKQEAQTPSVEAKKKIEALERQLEAQKTDFDTLKKQASGQAMEFDSLATKYNKLAGNVSNKRND